MSIKHKTEKVYIRTFGRPLVQVPPDDFGDFEEVVRLRCSPLNRGSTI